MRSLLFVIISFIFVVSPYAYGLYFNRDFYGLHIILNLLLIIMVLTILYKREIDQTVQFSFIIIMPLLYFISFFYSEHPLGSIDFALRWLSYGAVFLVLLWAAVKEKWIQTYLPIVFMLLGILLGLHMLFNVVEWAEFPSAFIFNRFSGVFQYPNTFGAIMAMFTLFSLIMLTNKRIKTYEIILYAAPLTLFMYMLLGSFSRGMFIILPIVFIIALFFIKVAHQLMLLIITMISGTGALLLVFLDINNFMKIFVLIIFSIIVPMVVYYLKKMIDTRFKRFNNGKWKVLLPSAVSVSGILLIADLLYQGLVFRLLPNKLQEQVLKLSDVSTFRERILFVEDSIKASSDSLIYGFGGRAWSVLYKSYQQLPYRSKQIHNGFLEILVDLGIIGLMVFILIFGFLYYSILKNYIKGQAKHLHLAVLMSLISIFFHSLIDFDFAFGTVWLIIFWLFAMSLAVETHWMDINVKKDKKKTKVRNLEQPVRVRLGKYLLYSYCLLSFIGIFISYQFMTAEQAFAQFKKTDNLNEKQELLIEATSKNKWNRDYLYELGNIYAINDNKEATKKVIAQLSEVEPNHSLALELAGRLAERIGDRELASNYYKKVLEIDQYNIKVYDRLFSILLESNSVRDAEQMLVYYEQFEKTYEQFSNNPIGKYHNSREFERTEKIESYVVKANELINKHN